MSTPSAPAIPQAFALATQHHQSGRLAEAEALYRQILTAQPHHAPSWHLLGVLAHQRGRHDLAIDWISHSLALNPGDPSAHYNLGVAFMARNQTSEAVAAFQQTVALRPDYADAWNNLAGALSERAQFAEAAAAFHRALELHPDSPELLGNLGNTLRIQGRLDDAISIYRRALQLQPNFPEVENNLAGALAARGLLDEAIAAYHRALAFKPDSPEVLNNLCNTLRQKGLLDEAEAAHRRALELRPAYPEAFHNVAGVFAARGQFDEAVAAFQKALELKPHYPEALNNLGHALKDQGKLDEALTAFRRALELSPKFAAAHGNLLVTSLYHPAVTQRTMRDETRRWAQQHCPPPDQKVRSHTNQRDPEKRLRIGYVSPDFHQHVVGRNVWPLFQHHDSEHFEIFSYSVGIHDDDLTQAFRTRSARWQDTTGMPDPALAAMIHRDQIDVLVDLSQHTAGNRLRAFAHEPAPVQFSFAGYPESTGLESIRYRISDRYLESDAETAGHNSEHIFLLDSFWCYDPCGIDLAVSPLPAEVTGHITFGSLNNFCKINEPVLKLWARVLRAVNGSRLLLLAFPGSHCERARSVFEQQGVEGHRLEFASPCDRRGYLELYHQLDIVLDPFPYNGHTTSLDALWMGNPVVSLAGDTPLSRAGFSQLSNLALPDLFTYSQDTFVETASRLANDLPRLSQLRRTLRARMQASPLMDGARFASGVESAYRAAWRHWCLGK